MEKFSRKTVSKTIYVFILKETTPNLLQMYVVSDNQNKRPDFAKSARCNFLHQ